MNNELELPKVSGTYKFSYKIPNWFDLKGRAEILFRPKNVDDLVFFLKNVPQNLRIQTIGVGSNIIIPDDEIKGVVIKLTTGFLQINHDENFITIGAGVLCFNVAQYCKNFGLGGLEFLSGIPGSIGGAIAMNAGCYDADVSQFLESAQAVDYQGNISILNNRDFGFKYRGNAIAEKYIFTAGKFKYHKSSSDEVANKIEQLQRNREISQPIRSKTGGSTFKNPANHKAWELIDAVGYRGKSIGDAQISQKHCNFLINNGCATAQDLINLGEEVRKKVFEKFAIDLEWEIKILS